MSSRKRTWLCCPFMPRIFSPSPEEERKVNSSIFLTCHNEYSACEPEQLSCSAEEWTHSKAPLEEESYMSLYLLLLVAHRPSDHKFSSVLCRVDCRTGQYTAQLPYTPYTFVIDFIYHKITLSILCMWFSNMLDDVI